MRSQPGRRTAQRRTLPGLGVHRALSAQRAKLQNYRLPMSTSANAAPGAVSDSAEATPRPEPGDGARLMRALSVTEVLGTAVLRGSRVLAGTKGLDRPVQRLNVMEVPDSLEWVKPHELLLTTGYPCGPAAT